VSVDQRGSRVLELGECRTLLAQAAASPGVGRVALNGDPSPHVIPVNFSITNTGILVRLGVGWTAFHLDGVHCTFEVDQAWPCGRTGWSVVVEGTARTVPYEEVARLGTHLPQPRVPRPGIRVFEIVPSKVTGRSLDNEL
jgi:nitroimidazol reductase NimA-like FMN-containing flavoprotein (pyridoxamine 5'-phosphate oxidase superfamily)